MRLALRALLKGEDSDRHHDLIAEYVLAKALSGHFGFFRLVIELVDGRARSTDDERIGGASGECARAIEVGKN